MAVEEVGVKFVTYGEDEFKRNMSSAEKSTDKFVQGVKDADQAVQKSSKGFLGLNLSLTDLKSGLDMASRALQYVGQVYDVVVDSTVKYAEQVRDLSRISGASAEETSRLIQTADDLKVEYGVLQQAAKALAQDGIALTTEELARASDEYLAIEDSGARAEYAVKKFGRAGLELTKVLETGGEALRDMAAGQSKNLILSEKQLEQARDLEKLRIILRIV